MTAQQHPLTANRWSVETNPNTAAYVFPGCINWSAPDSA